MQAYLDYHHGPFTDFAPAPGAPEPAPAPAPENDRPLPSTRPAIPDVTPVPLPDTDRPDLNLASAQLNDIIADLDLEEIREVIRQDPVKYLRVLEMMVTVQEALLKVDKHLTERRREDGASQLRTGLQPHVVAQIEKVLGLG